MPVQAVASQNEPLATPEMLEAMEQDALSTISNALKAGGLTSLQQDAIDNGLAALDHVTKQQRALIATLSELVAELEKRDYKTMAQVTLGGGKVVYGDMDSIIVAQRTIINEGRLRYAIRDANGGTIPADQALQKLGALAEMREIPAGGIR